MQLPKPDTLKHNEHDDRLANIESTGTGLRPVIAERVNTVSPEQIEQQFGITAEDKIYITAGSNEEQQVHQVSVSETHVAEITDVAANTERVPSSTNTIVVATELSPKEIDRAIINREFAGVVERFDTTEAEDPVPEFAPDAEMILSQLDLDAELDEDGNPVDIEGGSAEFVQTDDEGVEDLDELLSEADLQLLEEWAVLMADAQPEDFAISAEDEMSIEADYQQILEQIDGTEGVVTGEMIADVVETATDRASEVNTEIPAEVTPMLATAVEQISEHIALLDSEEVAETHVLLADVSRELQAVEKIVLDPEAAAESVAEVEEAEKALIQSIQRLCEHIGLEYSDEQIVQLVQQLLEQQVGTINLHNETMVGSAEINQIDLNIGTHEALSWFLSSIKQLKKQTNWLHLHLLLGKQIMALIPDVFAVT